MRRAILQRKLRAVASPLHRPQQICTSETAGISTFAGHVTDGLLQVATDGVDKPWKDESSR